MAHMSQRAFSAIRNPDPIPEASLADVKAVLEGLAPGRYRSADLYAKYRAILASQGREPTNQNAFGLMLGRHGLMRIKVRGSNGWLVQ